MWNFLRHLLVSDSFDCVYPLCSIYKGLLWSPPSSLVSDKFLIWNSLKIGGLLKSSCLSFWQQVVCSTDSQILFSSETFQLWKQDSNVVVQELTVATITQLCHHPGTIWQAKHSHLCLSKHLHFWKPIQAICRVSLFPLVSKDSRYFALILAGTSNRLLWI